VNSICVNQVTGDVAYTAGSVIVIYSPRENKQAKYLHSPSGRSFSCVVFSPDGKHVAAGEGAFKQPEISIWTLQEGISSL